MDVVNELVPVVQEEEPRRSLRIRNQGEESNDHYEVDHIVGKRRYRGRLQYKVRWVGYDESDDQWVDEDDIDAAELIAEYEEIHG